jgi:hypothetical protein
MVVMQFKCGCYDDLTACLWPLELDEICLVWHQISSRDLKVEGLDAFPNSNEEEYSRSPMYRSPGLDRTW